MLKLERMGSEVYCNGRKLTIITQASKGEGKEVVKIDGLEGSNGQQFVSLSRLVEGMNEIECKARTYTSKYSLTDDEQKEVNELQARIDEIIAQAKARFVPSVKKPITKMSIEELEAYIANLKSKQN